MRSRRSATRNPNRPTDQPNPLRHPPAHQRQVWKRVAEQFTSMFRRKAFLHWYTGERVYAHPRPPRRKPASASTHALTTMPFRLLFAGPPPTPATAATSPAP